MHLTEKDFYAEYTQAIKIKVDQLKNVKRLSSTVLKRNMRLLVKMEV